MPQTSQTRASSRPHAPNAIAIATTTAIPQSSSRRSPADASNSIAHPCRSSRSASRRHRKSLARSRAGGLAWLLLAQQLGLASAGILNRFIGKNEVTAVPQDLINAEAQRQADSQMQIQQPGQGTGVAAGAEGDPDFTPRAPLGGPVQGQLAVDNTGGSHQPEKYLMAENPDDPVSSEDHVAGVHFNREGQFNQEYHKEVFLGAKENEIFADRQKYDQARKLGGVAKSLLLKITFSSIFC